MFRYRFGIEEEYFIIDLRSRDVCALMPKDFFESSQDQLKGHVTNELLQSQIEVATSPCYSMAEARDQIASFRTILDDNAARFGLGIVACATHPLAIWREQKRTPKDRYRGVMSDVQMIGLRNLLCGMHVHVETPQPGQRIEIIYRTIPFLPILLALSTSSPFWEGHQTGLLGYRQAANEEMPRSGLPELFKSTCAYESYVNILISAGVIKDASYIWWAIRPSLAHPTIELRLTDICTNIDDAICIAALFRCLVRHLVEHPEINADLDVIDRAFADENKWRAERYGVGASFIDRASMSAKPLRGMVEDLIDRLRDDAETLDCVDEIVHAREIIRHGTSANQQILVYSKARIGGRSRKQALKEIVDWLHAATTQFKEQPTRTVPALIDLEERRIF
jgi:carboxylate-amine ligase